MLANLLDPARWDLELIAPETLTAELLDQVAERAPGRGLHRGDPARRPAHYPLPVQAAAGPVPGPEDSRLPVGAANSARTNPDRGTAPEAGADSIAPSTLLETRQQLASSAACPGTGPDRDDANRGSNGAATMPSSHEQAARIGAAAEPCGSETRARGNGSLRRTAEPTAIAACERN